MATTEAKRIESIIGYLREKGHDGDVERLEIPEDEDCAGWAVETLACDENGYYDSLHDASLVIADDWDGVLCKSNNGWEWLGIDKDELSTEEIACMVEQDRTLSREERIALTKQICAEVGIRLTI